MPPAKRRRIADSSDDEDAFETASAKNDEAVIDKICSICFCELKRNIARPKCCDHEFCYTCLMTWAKQNDTCPLDRKKFSIICLRWSISSSYEMNYQVERREAAEDEDEDEDEDDTVLEEELEDEEEEEHVSDSDSPVQTIWFSANFTQIIELSS